MELYKAIHTILNKYGKDLIAEERLINFLSDYHAFDVRATRRVLHTFLQMGYGKQVLELDIQRANDRMLKINNISMHVNLQHPLWYGMAGRSTRRTYRRRGRRID